MAMTSKILNPKWTFNKKEINSSEDLPENSIGFIYKITNETNGKIYYGRKTFRGISKKKLTKKEKLEPENKRKIYKYVSREYKGWLDYNGSCIPLLEDIAKGHKIKKEIVRICYSKSELTYYEVKAIICSDCLEREDCYNGNILGKIFPPKTN